MEYLFVSLLLLGCTYYTIKSAIKDAFYDILKSLNDINITYTKTKPNLDYYDERYENLDELD